MKDEKERRLEEHMAKIAKLPKDQKRAAHERFIFDLLAEVPSKEKRKEEK